MAEQAEKYVVLHTGVDGWRQGEVLHRDHLFVRDANGQVIVDQKSNQPVDRLERLMALGAIRPAAEHEARLSKVPLTLFGEALPAEAQALLATKDAEIDQLTRALAAVKEKAAFHERQGTLALTGAPEQDPALAPLIAEKDAQIESLRQQLASTHEAVGEAQGRLAERDQSQAEADSKLRGGREFPAGSTGHEEHSPLAAAKAEQPPGQQQTNAEREAAAQEQARAAQRQRQEAEARRQAQADEEHPQRRGRRGQGE